jgi:hypothetical protein
MVEASADNAAAVFRTCVEEWLRAVATEQWNDAVALLDEANSHGVRWSAAKIRSAIDDYSPGSRVCDPSTVGSEPRITIGEFDDGSGYWLDYSVPINGAWSDLTAQFVFKRRMSRYAVILNDLHVL